MASRIAPFGVQDGLDLTRARVEKRRMLVARHGVRLLDWRFDVPVTRTALADALAGMGIFISGEDSDPKLTRSYDNG